MKSNKYIIRRTLSQERFEVLWTKNKNGYATLKDLTEMDEIINRDEGVRRFVLEEMAGKSLDNNHPKHNMPVTPGKKEKSRKTFFEKVKTFFRLMIVAKKMNKTIYFPTCY